MTTHAEPPAGAVDAALPRPRRALVLFARPPQCEARVKCLEGAAEVFVLARDRVLQAAATLTDVRVIVAGEADAATLPAEALLLDQRGRDFGERLENAFADVHALGFDHVVAVGIDAPSLTAEHLADAFAALDGHAAVLGPAADGGVYLVGVRGPVGERFAGVRWQTRHVLADLRARCAGAAVLAATLVDVDRLASLRQLLTAPALDPELARLLVALLGVSRPPRSRPTPGGRRRRPFDAPVSRRGPPVILCRAA